ncbi:MAG TPA: hypothetical protein PLJ21_09790 [Pseudobdellovibrionaceae bacterium]|nr:hypothetical protein [Pseudobdellovibrionaceae bacterium]
MDDDPNTNKGSLKHEWNLLWKSLSRDFPEIDEDFEEIKHLEAMTFEDIKKITKNLSQNRKSLHQQLEELQKNIKIYEDKLESVRLVHGDTSDIEIKLSSFIDSGESLIEALQKIDDKIKILQKVRDQSQKDSST